MTLPTQYYIYIGKTLGCHHAPKGVAATFFRAVRGAWLAVLICFTAVLPGVLSGCGSEAPPMGDAVRNRDSLPVMISYGVSKLISDSGFIKYKVITEEWQVYDKTKPERWEFPKGLFLERYDRKFKVNMYITADTAYCYDQRLWELRGHVELIDKEDGTQLTTEELYWDVQSGELKTDVYFHLIKPDRDIEGDYLRALVTDQRVQSFYVKRSRGFAPMEEESDPLAAPAPPAGTASEATPTDTLPPLREKAQPRSKEHPSAPQKVEVKNTLSAQQKAKK